jgi:AcrR family transcriptional regulator
MPRSVKEEEYAIRRNQILDVAQRLVYTKGYGQMTIQDILDEMHISKGAFYHYFDSKGAVLEALVERMAVTEVLPLLTAIVYDPDLSAIEKLNRYFSAAGRWKIAKKTFMLELLRVWLADENAIVRQKMFSLSIEHVSPLLTEIIHQGIREGSLTTSYPDQMSEVIYSLVLRLGDTFGLYLLSYVPGRDDLRQLQILMDAYTEALERVLGAPKGSLILMDSEALEEWFVPTGDGTLVVSEEPLAGEAMMVEPEISEVHENG